MNCRSTRREGELLLFGTAVSWLATTGAGVRGSHWGIVEEIGLCYSILCPLLGGLLSLSAVLKGAYLTTFPN